MKERHGTITEHDLIQQITDDIAGHPYNTYPSGNNIVIFIPFENKPYDIEYVIDKPLYNKFKKYLETKS